MGKVVLHVCDSCDIRDRIDDESTQKYDIQTVRVLVHVGADDKHPKQYAAVMLCEDCREDLDRAIINAITQKAAAREAAAREPGRSL